MKLSDKQINSISSTILISDILKFISDNHSDYKLFIEEENNRKDNIDETKMEHNFNRRTRNNNKR